MSQQNALPAVGFDEMNLPPRLCATLKEIGYETPTPIQSRTIPHMIAGRDLLGQARTGTGKTAAFALPLLSRIVPDRKNPQILVLTPTRELAIQVAHSFETYGRAIKGLNVLPIYGGQSYVNQLRQLKRGVHVVVGTPGRLMDHLQRGTLDLSGLFCVVLDEADEMLHMGFIADVQWILDRTPDGVQTALFSATMPGPIKKISQKYLSDPQEILVRTDTQTPSAISQRFWMVRGMHKTHALVRILGALIHDGVIVFTRTRTATVDVAKHLEEKGFRAEALNGDMAQSARERTIGRLKNGHIDILVATDVAARGLDVERISHVINYDMPDKVDPYIHRIGRTGRAGRTGEAILFVHRNERWMVRKIERITKQKIKEMQLPSNREINRKRIAAFNDALTETLENGDIAPFEALIQAYVEVHGEKVTPIQVAAALGRLAHGNGDFLLPDAGTVEPEKRAKSPDRQKTRKSPVKQDVREGEKQSAKTRERQSPKTRERTRTVALSRRGEPSSPDLQPPEKGMERFRIEVGRSHGVNPRDIVGAISNEAGLEGRYIGDIHINREFSLVELPVGMPREVFCQLQKVWVRSRQMAISRCA